MPRWLALGCLLLITQGMGCQPQDPPKPDVLDSPGAVVDSSTADVAPGDGGDVRMDATQQRRLIEEDTLWEEALRLHYDAVVVDGHVDTPGLMLDDGYDVGVRHGAGEAHVDLPRMFEGGLDAAFFSIYVAPYYGEGERATKRARDLIAEVKRQIAGNADSLELATSAADVRRIARAGKKAALLGLEGGHALAASPDVLRELYAAGVRYVTLTHINTNSLADASQGPPRWGGLSEVGRALVREMNQLGLLVDLAHASDSTFYDVLAVTEAPVLVSHSSMRALVDNVRNVDDAMLRALVENGGVVMVNFFDAMVNPHLDADAMAEVHRRLGGRTGNLVYYWSTVYDVKGERGLPGAALDDVLDHIDHAVRVAGVDHVGLGSDFDGVFDLPSGLEDVTRLPWITYGLLKRGYSEADVRKILGGNVLRVMEAAERVAAPPPPSTRAPAAAR